MELMPGYKQTLAGVIPDDWQLTWLGAHGETFGGLTGKTKKDFGTGDAQYVTFMNVISNVVIACDVFDRVHISPAESQNRVRKNDLLFNGSSETPEEVAFCAVHIEDVSDLYLNSFCFGFRLRDHLTIDPLFLAYLFRSRAGRELVKVLAQGSTRYNISKRALLGAPLAIPPAPEQQAIAIALSDMDALLASFDQLIAKKRDLKQAAMQQLLTGKTRLPGFSGEWEVNRLGEIAEILKGSALSKSLIDASGMYQCILYGELFTRYGCVISNVISRTNSSEGCQSKFGDVLLPGSTTTTGADLATASALLVEDIALGGDIIVVRRIGENYNPSFLANYLTHVAKLAIAELTQGITIHHLYGKDMKTLPLRLPPLTEQTAIAAILSDMDAELSALETRRDKTRALKQAMMQELLTGKTRLV